MGDLKTWAKENSPYLKIDDDSEVDVIYRGYSIVEDSRDPSKTKIRYKVEENGKVKWFESGASRIAMVFDSFKEGEEITIRRNIVNGKAKYDVWKVGAKPKEESEGAGVPWPDDEVIGKKKK